MANTTDRVLLPDAVRPVHYTLELKPDLTNFSFAGTVDILVNVVSATDRIVLHARDLSIVGKAVFEAAAGGRAESVEIAYNSALSTVSFSFPSLLQVGEGTVHLSFTGELNNKMAGFYRSRYNDIDGSELYMAATQFESLDARRCFPCWDEPAAKATFSATLVVPSHLCALSNMPEVSSSFLPGGLKRVVFDRTPVMSTYLLAFCVGKFDCLQTVTDHGVALNVYTLPGMADRGHFALSCGKRCLDFYDDYFEIPYPLPKLDMIVVTEFAAGAMENWGLVTYRENALMLDENADISMKQRVALVICHELAHQWFGNLVTMRWWSSLWLNEGFASFMQHSAVDYLFPEWSIWEQYTTDTIGMAQKLDALRSSHPIEVPIKHAEEVEEVFDHISYAKGSTVVRMAEFVLGKEKFRKGLQVYLNRHKYSNTETADLWTAWTEVSGIDMNALMASWTEKMGYPYLKVLNESWSASECVLQLQQCWFLVDGTGETESATWNIPLAVATSSDSASTGTAEGIDSSAIASSAVFERRIPLAGAESSDAWVKLNAGQAALVRVAHSESMLLRMLNKGIREKGLSAIDRAAVLDDQFSLATAGLAPLEAAAMLLAAYGNEDNSTVWRSLHPILLGFNSAVRSAAELRGNDSASTQAVEAFAHFVKTTLVLPALARFGWDAKPGEPDVHKLMRGSVFGLVEEFCFSDADIAAEAKKRFDASVAATIENPASDDLAADIKGSVYRIALRNGGQAEFDALMKMFNSTNTDSVRKWVTSTLGSAVGVALKQRVMEWAISGEVKLQDCFYPMTSVAGASAEGIQVAWTFFKENFDRLSGLCSSANAWTMQYMIMACTSRLSSKQAADEMSAFFQDHPVPSASRKISQILEKILVNAKFAEMTGKSKLLNADFWENLR